MTLQDWGAIGDLVGGVAIIVSLLYVGLQIRHGTNATRSATNQAFSAQYSEIMLRLTCPEFSVIWWKGLQGLNNLENEEVPAFMGFMAAIVRTYETFYFERLEGRFESRMFESWMTQLIDVFDNEGARDYWELRRHNFSPEFATYVEEEVARSSPSRMYPGTIGDKSD